MHTALAKVATVATGLAMATSMLSLAPIAHATCSVGTANLTIGSSGVTVTCLQQMLIASGYSIPAGATGYFGAQTQTAVVRWQVAAHVSPSTGYFGPLSHVAWASSWSSMVSGGTSTVANCGPGAMFNSTTGQPCSSSTSTALPPGCTSATGFSTATGIACSGSNSLSFSIINTSSPVTTPTSSGGSPVITSGGGGGVGSSGGSSGGGSGGTTTTTPVNYTLSLAVTGSGSVVSSPSGISCGATCGASFTSGTSVTLSNTPSAGYSFTAWSGACSGTGSCVVSMSQARSVSATFTAVTVPVNGVCGTSNGSSFATVPTTNLCAVGSASAVSGSGPWSWSCAGSNGGSPASCSAGFSGLSALAIKITAAQTTASNSASCKAISVNTTGSNDGFYWEIGNQNGIITDSASGLQAAGSVQPAGTPGTNYTRTTSMLYASASKFIYGAYAAEKLSTGPGQMPALYVPHLNFTSGYTNMQDSCPYVVGTPYTSNYCMTLTNSTNGLSYGTLNSADIGHFFYNSGHFQTLAGAGDPAVGNPLGEKNEGPAVFTSDILTAFSAHGVNPGFNYWAPWPAGGGRGTAANYAAFLQGIVQTNNPLVFRSFLNPTASDPYAVCTNTSDTSCGSANSHYSPIPQRNWHYGIGHWIEDDATGDGSYSSPGKFGFYPWIDATKTYYGLVARYDTGSTNDPIQQGYHSALCGATIRQAFMTGVVQN